jgi:anaerobic magnesium-protoporphyrin IX monomethyl ester cyclase
MKKALFVYPNLHAQIGFNYGISYMSGLLKARGIETRLLNINEQLGYPLDLEKIKKDVLAFSPDIIGFSVLSNQHKYAMEIARDMRRYTEAPLVFGGIHPTMDPKGTLSGETPDCICIGEGEDAFLELVEKGGPKGVRNMGYREKDEIVLEPLRPYTDLSALPFKDYDIFDFQQMIDAKDGWVGLLAGRGCPFRCTYCLNHKIIQLYRDAGHLPKHYIRRHTVDEVLAEVEYLLKRYKRIKMFIFDDDIFTFDKSWVREFSEKYPSVTNTSFVCNAHVKMFDDEVAHYLKKSGCRIVKFGLESGSDRIRRTVLGRYMSNADIEKAFAAAHKYDLHTSAFLMIGLPCEEKRDLMETVRLLATVKPGRFRWSLFFPYIGTRAYEIAEQQKAIDFERWKALDNFTDETCMDLGEEVNLLVEKIKDALCTFVNGYTGDRGMEDYRAIVEEIESLDADTWQKEKERLRAHISELDRTAGEKGRTFYTVKYNRFMGVRSDWKDDSLSA